MEEELEFSHRLLQGCREKTGARLGLQQFVQEKNLQTFLAQHGALLRTTSPGGTVSDLSKYTEFFEQCSTRIIGPHNAPIEINIAGTLGSYLNTSKATSGNIIILSVAPSF